MSDYGFPVAAEKGLGGNGEVNGSSGDGKKRSQLSGIFSWLAMGLLFLKI